MPTDPKLLEKIVALIATAHDLHLKAGAVLDEIDALLTGKATIGTKIQQLTAAFDLAWCARYAPGEHGRYVWAHARDRAGMKRIIGKLGIDEVERRLASYIASNEDYVLKARHPFALFVATINRYAGEAVLVERVPGCLHVPVCTSDAQHTRRQQAALRGGSHSGPTGDVL